MYYDTAFAQIFTGILGLMALRLLPWLLKRTNTMQYVGDQGLMYIYVASILYLGIIHIILPLGSLGANFISGVF